jgi:HEAT repeat protein
MDRGIRRRARATAALGFEDIGYFAGLARAGVVNDSMNEGYKKLVKAISSSNLTPFLDRHPEGPEHEQRILDSLYGRVPVILLLETLQQLLDLSPRDDSLEAAIKHFTLKAVALRIMFNEGEKEDIRNLASNRLLCITEAYRRRIEIIGPLVHEVALRMEDPPNTPVYNSRGFSRSLAYLEKQIKNIIAGKKVSDNKESWIRGIVGNLRHQNYMMGNSYEDGILDRSDLPSMGTISDDCKFLSWNGVIGPALIAATDTDQIKYMKQRKKPRRKKLGLRSRNPIGKGKMRRLPKLKKLPEDEREGILDLVDSIDPTSRGRYAHWILQLVLSGNIVDEDASKVREWLEDYIYVSKTNSAIIKNYPLNKKGLKSKQELFKLVSRLLPDKYALDAMPHDLPGVVEYQNVPSPYRILKCEGEESIPSAQKLAEGTGWCTEGESQSKHYLEENPLIVILKDDVPFVQAHIGLSDGLQVKDIDDAEIDTPEVRALLEGIRFYERAFTYYERRLTSESSNVRRNAAKGLAGIDSPAAAATLARLVKDYDQDYDNLYDGKYWEDHYYDDDFDDPELSKKHKKYRDQYRLGVEIRKAAISGLSDMEKSGADSLVWLLENCLDSFALIKIIEALRDLLSAFSITDEGAGVGYSVKPSERARAASALLGIMVDSVDSRIPYVRDAYEEGKPRLLLYEHAAKALCSIKDPKATPSLIDMVNYSNDSGNPRVREAAIQALAWEGSGAADTLIQAATSGILPHNNEEIITALGKIQDPVSIDFLFSGLLDRFKSLVDVPCTSACDLSDRLIYSESHPKTFGGEVRMSKIEISTLVGITEEALRKIAEPVKRGGRRISPLTKEERISIFDYCLYILEGKRVKESSKVFAFKMLNDVMLNSEDIPKERTENLLRIAKRIAKKSEKKSEKKEPVHYLAAMDMNRVTKAAKEVILTLVYQGAFGVNKAVGAKLRRRRRRKLI